jgi:hypothetical protein
MDDTPGADALAFYAAHDRFTDPGAHAALLGTLPDEPAALMAALNGAFRHVWKVRKWHPEWLERRPHDVFTRRTESLLARAAELGDGAPLSEERPEERRVIIDCRSFALLYCAALRQRRVPTRPRCGFASYLEDTHWQDHWVGERWDAAAGCWVRDDPDLQKRDVDPSTEFLDAARAWRMGRQDPASVARFGWGPDMAGLWAVRLDLAHDFAALNGWVAISGDGWGLGSQPEEQLTEADRALLDRAAELSEGDARFAERRALYENDKAGLLRPPATVSHFDYVKTNRSRDVDWASEP